MKRFFSLTFFIFTSNIYSFFLDGSGHYSLRPEFSNSPGFSSDRGQHQATQHDFRLLGEIRMNERASFFGELRLGNDFHNEHYLGDNPQPYDCADRSNETDNSSQERCSDRNQNVRYPGYSSYLPRFTQAYAQYAFDFCILKAGRRGKTWGLGALMDSGASPFSRFQSVYDGVECEINMQRLQTLGFSVAYDKLGETGVKTNNPYEKSSASTEEKNAFDNMQTNFGPTAKSDDYDQYTLSVMLDDRKSNTNSSFAKNIALNYSKITGGDGNTDLNLLDIYSGFYLSALTFKNEFILQLGKTRDPSFIMLGGQRENHDSLDEELAESSSTIRFNSSTNKTQALGLTGELAYTMSRSGAYIGPQEFHDGDAQSHSMFFEYAYAPGDADGYYKDTEDSTWNDKVGETKRDKKVTAMSFHPNFKPALIFFNGHSYLRNLRVDGVFEPDQFINAKLFALGYRMESVQYGNFSVKLLTAQLNEKIPDIVKQEYISRDLQKRPFGFAGSDLGYEIDFNYNYFIGREVELGGALAYAIPGKAWQVDKGKSGLNQYLVQSTATFKF